MLETIGSRIALFRHSKKWTQEHLASEVNILQSTLSDIENDKISPKWELIEKIASTLEIPIMQIIPGSEQLDDRHSSEDTSANIQTVVYNNNILIQDLLRKVLETQNQLIEMLRRNK